MPFLDLDSLRYKENLKTPSEKVEKGVTQTLAEDNKEALRNGMKSLFTDKIKAYYVT